MHKKWAAVAPLLHRYAPSLVCVSSSAELQCCSIQQPVLQTPAEAAHTFIENTYTNHSKSVLGNPVPFPEEGMQPNGDFLPPYVQPLTVSVSDRAQPRPPRGSTPLVQRVSVTGEGLRRHVARWRANSKCGARTAQRETMRTKVEIRVVRTCHRAASAPRSGFQLHLHSPTTSVCVCVWETYRYVHV